MWRSKSKRNMNSSDSEDEDFLAKLKKSDEGLNSDVADKQMSDDDGGTANEKIFDEFIKEKKQNKKLTGRSEADLKENTASGSGEEKIDKVKKKKQKLDNVEKEKSEPGTSSKDSSKNAAKTEKKAGKGSNADDNFFVDIGRNRRVALQTYKGTQSVGIREFYLDKNSGEMKPGKIGINLNELEWKKLLTLGDKFKF